jgi:hypothetical protein
MPANNRVHSSAALQTHGIWQSAIGYDPYAPNKEEKDKSSQKSAAPEPDESENAYASFQGLLALARITGSNADEARGSCKKCGRVGHLTFQCRNFLSAKDEGDREGKDAEAIQAAVLSGLEKLKGERVKVKGENAAESEESSEGEESETSDSDFDSEIERAIAEKYGRSYSGGKLSGKIGKKYDSDESDDDGSEGKSRKRRKKERRERKKRGRSKKRGAKRENSDSEDEGRRKRRNVKRRRRDDDISDEEEERRQRRRKTRKEKRRRRSHRNSDDNSSDDSAEQRHKRRSRRAYLVSDSDASGSHDSRVGRDKKRSDKKGRNPRHKED